MPIDPAVEAQRLAQVFYNLSRAVDQYRLDHYAELSPAEQQRLKDNAQALDTRAHWFTAAALEAILAGITPHLEPIKKATADARDVLATLRDIEKAVRIVDAAVALGGAIASGNPTEIGAGVETLRNALTA